MSRTVDSSKKESLLKKCMDVVVDRGSLRLSLHDLASSVGTSGRMLVYYFGTKENLEREMVTGLEAFLRQKLMSMKGPGAASSHSPGKTILKMWSYYTSLEMSGYQKLCLEMNLRALEGDGDARTMMAQESAKWIDVLAGILGRPEMALPLYHLIQGAVIDFLTSGNAARGRKSLTAFLKSTELIS